MTTTTKNLMQKLTLVKKEIELRYQVAILKIMIKNFVIK